MSDVSKTASMPRGLGHAFSALSGRRDLGVILFLLFLALMLSVTTEQFLTACNLLNIGRAIIVLGIIAVGETFVIISGEFDISGGSIYGLAGVTVALLMKFNFNPWLALVLTLIMGASCGLLNGALTAYARIPSFIVTLGTLNVYRVIAFMITEGRSANPLQGDLPRSVIQQF